MSISNSPLLLGNIYPSNGQAGNIYSVDYCSPCVPGFSAGGGGKELKVLSRCVIKSDFTRPNNIVSSKVERIGNLYGFTGGSFSGMVYTDRGLAPSINTAGGGNRMPIIIEVKRD